MRCTEIQADLLPCQPVDNRKDVEKLITVTKDKFLKFLLKNQISITSISIGASAKKGEFPYRQFANCHVTFYSYNMQGDYYLALTEKQINKLFKK